MGLDKIIDRNFTKISDAYRQFCIQKSQCEQCSIFSHYRQTLQSEGNGCVPIFMLIGESPGKQEIEQMRPFVGRAGQRLRLVLRKHRETFNKRTSLLTNILSCRPPNNIFPQDKHGPWQIKNKSVNKAREIVEFCANNWIFREIKILQPKIIVTLGAQPLFYIRNEKGITACRGSWKFLPDYRAWSFATYHPSYVIRCENISEKKYIAKQFEDDITKITETWSDIVDGDKRMSMSYEEWAKEKTMMFAIENRLFKEQPIK